MRRLIILIVFLLTLSSIAYCGQISRIQLSDGSVINGEIISYADGSYTVNTSAAGEVKIKAANISRIEPAATAAADTNTDKMNAYAKSAMSNPETAAAVTKLSADPQVQELARDPQIAQAAKSGDIQALMKNEKFMGVAQGLSNASRQPREQAGEESAQ